MFVAKAMTVPLLCEQCRTVDGLGTKALLTEQWHDQLSYRQPSK